MRTAAGDGGGLAPGPARGFGLRVSSYPAGRLLPMGGEAAVGGRNATGAVAGAGSRDRVGSPLAAALALLRLPRAGSALAPQVGHLACVGAPKLCGAAFIVVQMSPPCVQHWRSSHRSLLRLPERV